MELRQRALQALCIADPSLKVAQARELLAHCASLDIAVHAPPNPPACPAGPPSPSSSTPPRCRAARPSSPKAWPRCCMPSRTSSSTRSISRSTRCGASTACRREFYADWVRVAAEEAYHFSLLREHLAALGHGYGDFPAHDNLWAMCEKTKDDIVARMALVPRTLEARGLDATPLIQEKLRRVGSPEAHARRGDPRHHPAPTRSATSPSATTGTAGCASAKGSTRWRITAPWWSATTRRGCIRRSTRRRASGPASATRNWPGCRGDAKNRLATVNAGSNPA